MAYRRQHRLSSEQQRVMQAIEKCRTAALGGHVDECDQCGTLRISYNSCRNRHCPKCGALAKANWLEARQAELLPIEYYHVVFTTDHGINPLVRWNQATIYNLLFASAAETLKQFGRRYLGGEIGIVAVLHTWGQDLSQHVHLHCIVTGGALSSDGRRWQASSPGFLFAVKELSQAYRDRFCLGLEEAYRRKQIRFGGACLELGQEANFARLLAEMKEKDWEVYIRETYGGPEKVYDYLGRYVHRVAISNQRIVEARDGAIWFTYHDHREGGKRKVMKLEAEEFIRRFLLHVLPKGFVRIRYYGLLGGRDRLARLARCRELLQVEPGLQRHEREPISERMQRLTGVDLLQCPVCKVGRMVRRQTLIPQPIGLSPPGWKAVRIPIDESLELPRGSCNQALERKTA